jgi:hypothetical protein
MYLFNLPDKVVGLVTIKPKTNHLVLKKASTIAANSTFVGAAQHYASQEPIEKKLEYFHGNRY